MSATLQTPDAAARLIARIEAVPFSRWHLRPRLIVGSATFFDAFDSVSLAFVLPVLIREWRLSPSEAGWLIAVGYLGQLVGALLFGALAERVGRVRSAAAATTLMSVMSLACAAAAGPASLLALRFVQGIGVGGEMPVAAVYMNELSKAHGRGRFLLLYELIFPIGLLVTGQIGALVVPAFGWPVMFVIGGVPGLIIAALMLRLPESPRWLIAQGRLSEADAIVAAMEASAGRPSSFMPEDEAPIDEAPADEVRVAHAGGRPGDAAVSARWREMLSPFYRRRTLVVWTLWGAAGFFTNGLANWMPTLYHSAYGLELASALRAGTINTLAQILVLLACAFLIDRIGRRRWTVTCFAAGAALLAILGTFAAASVAHVLMFVTLGYGLVGSINAVLYLYTPEIYPTRMRAIGAGSATCWVRLASAASQLSVGYIVAAHGPDAVFLLFACAGFAGSCAAALMLETSNRRLEDIAS
jgi:MFS transporter, putative metabolite:H+ symporter